MRLEVLRSLPIAGVLAGLMLGLALDPAAEQVSWWPGIIGGVVGVVAYLLLRFRSGAGSSRSDPQDPY